MRPALFLIAVFVTGCGTSVAITPTNTPQAPLRPRTAERVEVFATGIPARPYQEVAMIEARQSSQYSTHDQSAVIAELRKAAGQHGCDAIIVNGSADQVGGGANDTAVSTLKGYRATCIVWTGGAPAATPAQACVPNESKACVGPAGCSGGQACNEDGTKYSQCDCGTG